MKRRRKWLLLAVGLGFSIGIAAYFSWGARLGAEYERQVDLLRESGEYVDRSELWNKRIPGHANMAAPLSEAATMLKALKTRDEELGTILNIFYMGWDYEGHGKEDFERLRKQWPKLKPYFDRLQSASKRPHFAPPLMLEDSSLESWCGIQDVAKLLQLRARIDPGRVSECMQLLLDIADRWKPDTAIASVVRSMVRLEGLEILHAALRRGGLDTSGHRGAWNRQLAAVDPVTTLRETARLLRMDGIRMFGEDVHALPWWTSWYGRPVLYREGLAMLAEAEQALRLATDEVGIRETLQVANPDGDANFAKYARALEELAVLRLARIAMMIEADARKRGRARASLDEYAATWGGPLPQNPFTNRPFGFERHDDKVVVRWDAVVLSGEPEVRRAAIASQLTWEELRVWEVRWKPLTDD